MAPAAQSSQQAYSKDERVLCFHHELLYEAKILDSKLSNPDDRKSQMLYRVHYKGWKNTWDDWVSGDRIRKLTDENRELAQNLKKEFDALRKPPPAKPTVTKKRPAGSDSARDSEERQSSAPAAGRKRGRDSEIEKDLKPSMSPDPSDTNTSVISPRSSESRDTKISNRSRVKRKPRAELATRDDPSTTKPSKKTVTSLSKPTKKRRSPVAVDDHLPETKKLKKVMKSPPELRGKKGGTIDIDELLSHPPPPEPRRIVDHGGGLITTYPLLTIDAPRKKDVRNPISVSDDSPYVAAKRHRNTRYQPDVKRLITAGVPQMDRLHTLHLDSPTDQLSSPDAAEDMPGRILSEIKDTNGEQDVNGDSFQEESFYSRAHIRIPCPDNLKSLLVDDWENVTKNLLLVKLPSKTPVNMILDTYFEEEKGKRRLGSAEADLLEEVVAGVKEYFDKCLGRILLYRFEREQFFELRTLWEGAVSGEWEGKGPGDVYGAEHLARLFVSMPELIAQTNMDHQAVNRLREELAKITMWLGRNSAKYFNTEYEAASQEYIDKARGV